MKERMRPAARWLSLVAAVLLTPPVQGETYEVWPLSQGDMASLSSLRSGLDVGEVFWYSQFCVVLADSPVQKANLDSLASYWHFKVILVPRTIDFDNPPRRAIWDPETRTWDRSIPGLNEIPLDSPRSLFGVLFKSYPNVSSSTFTWLQTFVDAGYVVGRQTAYRSMSVYVFGERDLLPSLVAGNPGVRAYVEVPVGLKRTDVGFRGIADQTSIRFVNVSTSEVKRRLIQRHGTLSGYCWCGTDWLCYADDLLTSAEALDWSRIPEVINLFRGYAGGPSGGGPPGGGSSPVDVPALGRFGLMALLAGIAFAGWRILRR